MFEKLVLPVQVSALKLGVIGELLSGLLRGILVVMMIVIVTVQLLSRIYSGIREVLAAFIQRLLKSWQEVAMVGGRVMYPRSCSKIVFTK